MTDSRDAVGSGFIGSARMKRGLAIAALTVAANLLGAVRGSAAIYAFTNLGSVAGNLNSGFGINNNTSVAVVGTLGNHPALSTGGGGLTSFNSTTGSVTAAFAVSDGGVIVGGGADGNPSTAFYRTISDPTLHALTTLGGASNAASAVTGTIANYEIVGRSELASGGGDRAFYFATGDAAITPLASGGNTGIGGSGAGAFSLATGVNSAGNIVGQATNAAGDPHAFYYRGVVHTMYDLGTASGSGSSIANAINASNTIAGATDVDGFGLTQAFIYVGAPTGTFQTLGSLDGSTGSSEALAINASGVVVGDSSADGGSEQHAFIYNGGLMTDLNTLVTLPAGYVLQSATGINDGGAITGYALDGSGNQTAFLLTVSSVPEPALTGLFLFGGSILVAGRRRRN